ncbi:unnamed protein product [Cuscuta campestris]|uniref:Water stress and hypersensitive response domain-containing protein n=2 Tax=Cuscuta sect. Cleistogrammica TaxID=1824901 RepID=A0A484NCL0_9ASTE|nr:hypothetical protein DM860_017950 [Cuscuta australis]VFQ98942.1 unnamed protein product [Cuscuta campestris]
MDSSGGQAKRWSWSSAFIGAAAATATAALLASKPRDPSFHLVSIDLTSLKLNFPVVDADVILTVHVSNPNIAPIEYSPTELSIFYSGSHLGSARVDAGSQPPRSCQLLRLPARLKGKALAKHSKKFVADVARREMDLDAAVDIVGAAKVLWRDQRFRVHVDSRVKVDPVLLDIVDQENRSKLEICIA